MTKSDGKCRIDSVAVGEIGLNLLGPTPMVSSKYALMEATSGERFGAGNRNANWSDETMKLVELLVASVEKDIASDLFESGEVTAQPAETYDTSAGDSVPGL